MNPMSIMPAYPWLSQNEVNLDGIPAKIGAMQTLGVPYAKGYDQKAVADYKKQAEEIVANLKESGVDIAYDKELIAVIILI